MPKITHTVPVLRKAVRVMEAVAHSHGDATAKRLASTLNISATTCYRILQSFVAEGWLRPRAGGAFELSFGLVPLLRPLLRHELLIDCVRAPLSRLARTTGLTAKITVRQGNDAVTIHSANSPRDTAIAARVGAIVSLAIGSSGAVFLSEQTDDEISRILDQAPEIAWKYQSRVDVMRRVREARRQGSCFDGGSYQTNVNTISSPLYAAGNELVGVITLLGFTQDFAGDARAVLTRELKYAAGDCTQLIQGPVTATAA
ncbi:MAG: helix-turn-helix domain-containing protein [Opitutus sp.]